MKSATWFCFNFISVIMFFGVVLIRSSSSILDTSLCLMTATMISVLAYLLADIDLAYTNWISDVEVKRLLIYLEDQRRSLSEMKDFQPSPATKFNPLLSMASVTLIKRAARVKGDGAPTDDTPNRESTSLSPFDREMGAEAWR